MLNMENNGDKFSEEQLVKGQLLLTRCLTQIAQEISPGMTETDGAEITKRVLKENGFGKNWHPPKIRFGANTLKTFSDVSDSSIVLQKDDMFFLDLGPIIANHECDYGQTFVLGTNPQHVKLRDASKSLFDLVKMKWKNEGLSGNKLYHFAHQEAKNMGYEFVIKGASGHRVGDFPHHLHYRGNLKDIEDSVAGNRWILEIQIHDRELRRGAFFEDIL